MSNMQREVKSLSGDGSLAEPKSSINQRSGAVRKCVGVSTTWNIA